MGDMTHKLQNEKRNNTHLSIAMALFILIAISGVSFALSALGGKCDYSRECIEGYCLNSTCRFPAVLDKFNVTGNCNYTRDCDEGFCKSNQCILPLASDFSISPIGAGFGSSCAGLIDNCTGVWCVFCNATWIILIVAAAGAAFISRKRGRMLPALLFVLPMMMGFIFFPIAGFILALIEILIIALVKKPSEYKPTTFMPAAPVTKSTKPPLVQSKPPAKLPTETPPTDTPPMEPMFPPEPEAPSTPPKKPSD